MAASPKYRQTMSLPTFTDIQAITAETGQKAVAEDTNIEYVYDGTAGTWNEAVNLKKLAAKSGTPILTLGPGAGTGATATIEGDNISGVINLTTGTALSTNNAFFTLTLADNQAFPSTMITHLSSIGASTFDVANNLSLPTMTASSNTFNLKGLSLSGATTYKLTYLITGYKK